MTPARSRRGVWFALLATVLTVGLVGPAATAAPEPTAGSDRVVQFAVEPTGGGSLSQLGQRLTQAGYDVYGGGGGLLLVHAPAAVRAQLAARSDVRIVREDPVVDARAVAPGDQDDVLPSRLDGNEYPTFYGGYRTNDGFTTFLSDLDAAYPELVQVRDFGTSYTADNPLQVACVTANAQAGCQLTPNTAKVRFLLVAQVHARELSTSEVAWRMLSYLADGYGVDADVTGLLDTTEVWIVPQANPDGIELVQEGIEENGLASGSDAWQRKNLNPGSRTCSGGSFSQYGVDLNRNFDSNWGGAGTSTFPCDLVYRGTGVASEPETQATQDLITDLFRDQRGPALSDPAPRSTRGAMISMHSYSNLVLFPFGDQRTTANDAGLRSFGFRMSNYNGYETGQPNEILYEVTGSTDDFAYEELGIAAFTYEIGPEFGSCSGFHPAYTCQPNFWNLNRDGLLYGMKAARQPYVMGLGPTITAASAAPVSGNPNLARITATANDAAYGNSGVGRPAAQNVTAGRVIVNRVPQPMTLVGSGTSVTLRVDLPRSSQRQLVYVQGRDAQGNWGPLRGVWVPAL